jgi:tRNA pseudouridine13 synthase
MLPRALFKQSPEDFVVDEIDAYPALGEGPHVLVRIRKRSLNTEQAVARIAEALGANRRDCGFAGMKDRDAVTTQRISVPNVDPARVMELAGRWPDLEILEAERHRNKLKPGHLRANRFRIRLREVERVDEVLAGLERIKRDGFPNAFGPQRFGRDGDNAERARALLAGADPGRDRRAARFLLSALQAEVFNAFLAARPLPLDALELGEVATLHASGGSFVVEDLARELPRAAAFEISASGRIFGTKLLAPRGAPAEREAAVLRAAGIPDRLATPRGIRLRGARRPVRAPVADLEVEAVATDAVRLRFTLPAGSYATVLAEDLFTEAEPGA